MMQSGVSGQDRTGRIVMKKGPARGDDAVVNSDMFRNKNAGDVPVDQVRSFRSSVLAADADVTSASALLPQVLRGQVNQIGRQGEGE